MVQQVIIFVSEVMVHLTLLVGFVKDKLLDLVYLYWKNLISRTQITRTVMIVIEDTKKNNTRIEHDRANNGNSGKFRFPHGARNPGVCGCCLSLAN
jgi:hypothetical protein